MGGRLRSRVRTFVLAGQMEVNEDDTLSGILNHAKDALLTIHIVLDVDIGLVLLVLEKLNVDDATALKDKSLAHVAGTGLVGVGLGGSSERILDVAVIGLVGDGIVQINSVVSMAIVSRRVDGSVHGGVAVGLIVSGHVHRVLVHDMIDDAQAAVLVGTVDAVDAVDAAIGDIAIDVKVAHLVVVGASSMDTVDAVDVRLAVRRHFELLLMQCVDEIELQAVELKGWER